MRNTSKKKTALQALTEHKQAVIEMWEACYTVRDIHNFISDHGATNSYEQVRKTLKKHFGFDTRNPGKYIDTQPIKHDKHPTFESTTPTSKQKFDYNPAAPNADSFWPKN